MTALPERGSAASDALWRARRRPGAGYLLVACAFALPLGVAGAWLMHALLLQPTWWGPLAMGGAISATFIATAARGARASLDHDGTLRYGWGAQPALELDLRDVTAIVAVRRGILRGVGLAIAPERVRFLHRRGPSPRRMRDDRARLGIDLVLEFLAPDDAVELDRLRVGLGAAPSAPRAS